MIRCLLLGTAEPLGGALRELFAQAGDVEVVADTADRPSAIDLAERLGADVLVVQLSSPLAAGLEELRQLVAATSAQLVVVVPDSRGEYAGLGHEPVRRDLAAVVPCPDWKSPAAARIHARAVASAVRVASTLHRRAGLRTSPGAAPAVSPGRFGCVGIAASTGGPAALQRVFSQLPADFPLPLLVVQHIAAGFSERMLGWLAETSRIRVKLAQDGEPLLPATAYFAQDAHLLAERGRIRLDGRAPVNGHRPSGTLLFESLAAAYGSAAVGVILTGMGDDGCAGLERLRAAGGTTLAQSGPSCVLNGMPKVALETGAATRPVELEELPAVLVELIRGQATFFALSGPGQRERKK